MNTLYFESIKILAKNQIYEQRIREIDISLQKNQICQ